MYVCCIQVHTPVNFNFVTENNILAPITHPPPSFLSPLPPPRTHTQFTVNDQQRNFVVAQGPMEHTCTDFWQMVWEQQIQFIIMVTNEVVSPFHR